jgi:hypothetical protein
VSEEVIVFENKSVMTMKAVEMATAKPVEK